MSNSHSIRARSDAAPGSELAGEWRLSSGSATLTIGFDGQGGGYFGDLPIRYRAQGQRLAIVVGGNTIEWVVEVHGDQLLVRASGSSDLQALQRTVPATAARAARQRAPGRRHADADRHPPDLFGTWLFYDSFHAHAGGHSTSDIQFTLSADGSYTYGAERSMSAHAHGMGVLTNGSDSDSGRWSVEDGILVADSLTRGLQRFRLTKLNHPKTGDPMLCLDDQCFVTQQARPPW